MSEAITDQELINGSTIFIPEELKETAAFKHYEGVVNLEDTHLGFDEYHFETPLHWQVDVTNTGGALLVQGTSQVLAQTACARCLEDVTYRLEGDIQGYFLFQQDEEEQDAPEDLEGDEFDVLPANRELDLMPLIWAGLLVEAPRVPLCQDDCKGLCSHCGANLNEGACGCTEEAAEVSENNPFAALKNLHFDE